MKKQQIIFTIYTTTSSRQVSDIMKLAHDCGCNTIESRLSNLESTSVLTLFLSGNWDVIAKVETALTQYCQRQQLPLINQRVTSQQYDTLCLPYSVQVHSPDKPGILYEMVDYFSSQDIAIQEVYSTQYLSMPTMAPTSLIQMTILLPCDTLLVQFRDNFMIFCEELNVDAILEPEKT